MKRQPEEHLQPQRLFSLSQPVEGLTAASFLRLANGHERFYWRDGRRPEISAGFGVAAELKAWGKDRFREIELQARNLFLDAILLHDEQPLAAPRLCGGFAFRDDFVPDNTWAVFHPAHFILPHFQLTQVGEMSWLTINGLAPLEEDPGEVIHSLREALEMRSRWLLEATNAGVVTGNAITVGDLQIGYPMSLEAWMEMIEKALARIQAGEMKKVVLARMCEIRSDSEIDVDQVLSVLDERYAGCYRFLFEPRPHNAFIGATPELLAEVKGENLVTMALAGSIRRGVTPSEDAALAAELLDNTKERHEHHLVVEALRQRLAGRTFERKIPKEPDVLALSNIQHLYTPVEARLAHPEGVLPLVAHLHPTPALGGAPRRAALAYIRAEEPVTRGWYAAPVGWINHQMDGVFAVAIRSGVIQYERAWLYAGGGIVAGSDPVKEWDETALKFRPILEALGIPSQVLV